MGGEVAPGMQPAHLGFVPDFLKKCNEAHSRAEDGKTPGGAAPRA